jgi:transcriptional regulator GlxA family with amidase domain
MGRSARYSESTLPSQNDLFEHLIGNFAGTQVMKTPSGCASIVLLFATQLLCGLTASAAESAPLHPLASGKILVAVVLTQHPNLIDFAGPWAVFENVRVKGRGNSKGEDEPTDDQYPFEVFSVGDDLAPIKMSGGLSVIPRYTFDDAPVPQVVIVGAQAGSPKMKAWLQKIAKDSANQVVMSVCTGAFRLAGAGLLDGKPATTHHGYYDDFEKYFPTVKLQKGARFVRGDERVFTSGGLTSGIDLALHVVELYFGRAIADQTVSWMEYQGTGWHQHD